LSPSFVFQTLGTTVGLNLPEIEFACLKNETASAHRAMMQTLLDEHGLAVDTMHVVPGAADGTIPKVARDIQAQLVVMGAVGRTGLSGAFFGNTAEQVLSELSCEVLVLKPDRSK
jgi:universal stress protein E